MSQISTLDLAIEATAERNVLTFGVKYALEFKTA